MLDSINFKTELEELAIVEEVTTLFDNILKQYTSILISLLVYAKLSQLKKEIIEKAKSQQEKEQAKLLTEIAQRKREIKINIWKVLGAMGNTKKQLQEKKDNKQELEQLIYEEEQIINVYESSIRSLDEKEKQVITLKNQEINKKNITKENKPLKEAFDVLIKRILLLSEKHDNCFSEFEIRLKKIIEQITLGEHLLKK